MRNLLIVAVVGVGLGVAFTAIYLLRKRLEQRPQPQVPRYRYTTDRSYDEARAVAGYYRAKRQTATGRPIPPNHTLCKLRQVK